MVLFRSLWLYSLAALAQNRPGGMVVLIDPTDTTREVPMAQPHPSTPAQRAQWSSHMIAHAHEYGIIPELSRAHGVSRPTLYAWRTQAEQALIQTFLPATAPPPRPVALQTVRTCRSSATGRGGGAVAGKKVWINA